MWLFCVSIENNIINLQVSSEKNIDISRISLKTSIPLLFLEIVINTM